MILPAIRSLFGSSHSRALRKIEPMLEAIRQAESELELRGVPEMRMETERLRALLSSETEAIRTRIAELQARSEATVSSEERAEVEELLEVEFEALRVRKRELLTEMLPQAFAVVRETCRRLMGREYKLMGETHVWDMVPYDEQMIGGIVLFQGKVAEMATGEGKTLVATMPLYLNALAGEGAHLVTVNSYLAERDAQWMGFLFQELGLSVGCIDLHEVQSVERRAAYAADITYGTSQEFGFDYLRDNMAREKSERVQRGHYYVVVDEVDSVLIDDARTPLVISGVVEEDRSGAYLLYRDAIEEMYKQQVSMIDALFEEAEQLLAEGKKEDAAEKALMIKRGNPRYAPFVQLVSENPTLRSLIDQTEQLARRRRFLTKLEEAALLFSLDEGGRSVHLTEQGSSFLAKRFGTEDEEELFLVPDIATEFMEIENNDELSEEEKLTEKRIAEDRYAQAAERVHVVHALLRAFSLFHRDEQYVVQDGAVISIDELTGRLMVGRRWGEGVHQAVEAKEGLDIKDELQTQASITIQNYFRLYPHLAGMTGTAVTEEDEFFEIYKLDVVQIPTHRPVARRDHADRVYRTRREKYAALLDYVQQLHEQGLPVLVGTGSVDTSEMLSRLFADRGIEHRVLNAKHHRDEAEIVARAGQPGALTIATNMAGRGTDIRLGAGVKEIREGGHAGLQIVGTERMESRRIDLQLRGRAGRQGDPGDSVFFLSLEDSLMRMFGAEDIGTTLGRMGMQEGGMLSHPLLSRVVERAQKKVEEANYQARRHILKYDDVLSRQREAIYAQRAIALEGGRDVVDEAREMLERALHFEASAHIAKSQYPEEWNLPELRERVSRDYLIELSRLPQEEGEPVNIESREDLEEYLSRAARISLEARISEWGEFADYVMRQTILNAIDEEWKQHLRILDHLQDTVRYRAYGQEEPLVAYRQEAFEFFNETRKAIDTEAARNLMRTQVNVEAEAGSAGAQEEAGKESEMETASAD